MEATNSKKTQLLLPRRFEWLVFVVAVIVGAILICSSLELSKPLQCSPFSSQLLQNREEDVESLISELDALRKQLDEEKLKNKEMQQIVKCGENQERIVEKESLRVKEEECACRRPGVYVFNLALPKAGTSSFHVLMQQMGCHSAHQHVDRANMTKLAEINITQNIREIGRLMELAYWNERPLMYYFEDSTNAISQMDVNYPTAPPGKMDTVFPQILYYGLLLEQYPDSKFVLVKRNISEHIQSIDDFKMRTKLVSSNIPYLPRRRGNNDREMRIWIQSHYHRVTQYFNAMAPDHFLDVWLEENPLSQIASFLHCTGNYTMPHSNRNKNRPN